MDYYLIDYENTGENGLKGITDLSENSRVIIFYSENADKISFDMHQKLCLCRTNLEFRKIHTGRKNALDFQLSTFLGYLIAKAENDQFYIVSKDNGYRSVMDFWRDKKVKQIDFIARTTARPLLTTSMERLKEIEMVENGEPEKKEAADIIDTELEMVQEVLRDEPENTEELFMEPETDSTEINVFEENFDVFESETDTQGAETSAADDQEIFQIFESETEAQTEQDQEPVKQELTDQEPVDQEPADQEPIDQERKDQESDDEELIALISGAKETDPEPEEPVKKKRSHRGGKKKKASGKREAEESDEDEISSSLRKAVGESVDDPEACEHICRFIVKYKTKQGVHNAIVKIYGTDRALEYYKKIKHLLKDKKGK